MWQFCTFASRRRASRESVCLSALVTGAFNNLFYELQQGEKQNLSQRALPLIILKSNPVILIVCGKDLCEKPHTTEADLNIYTSSVVMGVTGALELSSHLPCGDPDTVWAAPHGSVIYREQLQSAQTGNNHSAACKWPKIPSSYTLLHSRLILTSQMFLWLDSICTNFSW